MSKMSQHAADSLDSASHDLLSVLRGCRDMLRESAKQHRINDDGHAPMCELHVRAATRAIARAHGHEGALNKSEFEKLP